MHADDDRSKRGSVSAQSRHSLPVVTTVVTYHSCDRTSCLGCGTLKLQALCYAAQQCSVVQCVGTVVNQVGFLLFFLMFYLSVVTWH